MNIDWPSFTPMSSLTGGLLIGIAASLYVLGNGRIAGIAGILGSPLRALMRGLPLRAEYTRLCFVAGLLAAPWLWRALAPLPQAQPVTHTLGLVVAGLLVGVGTRMANGCTSGHGVCGLSRLSVRSLVNVGVFMGAGMATVAAIRALG